MSRRDTASISFKCTLPPEVIKEYFDGLAKVESAKHPPTSNNSFDWSSLLSAAPLLLSLFSSANPSFVNKVKPKTRSSVKIPDEQQINELANKFVSEHGPDTTPEIVISIIPTQDNKESQESVLDEMVNDAMKEFTDKCKEEATDKDQEKLRTMLNFEDKMRQDPESKKSTPKRNVIYQEGDNVVVDMSQVFGGNNGGLVDMMKMFAPMMEGMMSGMNQVRVDPIINKGDDSKKESESTEQTENKLNEEEKDTSV